MHIPRWVYWAVAYLLVCQIQALSILDRVLYGEWVGKQGDALNQTVNILQIIIGLALFCRGFKHWSGVRKGSFLYISLAVFLLCSAAWSVNSGASLRAGLQYLFLIIGAIGAAENLEADDFMYLLAWVCFLAAVASLVLLVGFPANAYGGAGDFRGVFSQKNPLGEAMSMGALASLHGLWAGKRRRLFNLSTLVLTIFLTIKSQSATSLLTIFICGSLGIAIRLLQKGGAARAFAMTATMIMIPVILIAAFSWDLMLEMLGKDPTLTWPHRYLGLCYHGHLSAPVAWMGLSGVLVYRQSRCDRYCGCPQMVCAAGSQRHIRNPSERWTYWRGLVHLSVGTNSLVISEMHANV